MAGSHLAGGGAGLVALDAVVVLVVPVPVVLAPVVVVGQGLDGVGDLAVLLAELLAELGGARRQTSTQAPQATHLASSTWAT